MKTKVTIRVTADPPMTPVERGLRDGEIDELARVLEAGVAVTAAAPGKAGAGRAVALALVSTLRAARGRE